MMGKSLQTKAVILARQAFTKACMHMLLLPILLLTSGCADREVFQETSNGPITVEFFTETHDDPGIPVRARVCILNGMQYETGYLENYDMAHGNNYRLEVHGALKLATICNVKRPFRVLHIVDLGGGGHCGMAYDAKYQGERYWGRVKSNIMTLCKMNPKLSFSCYWDWRELVAKDAPE